MIMKKTRRERVHLNQGMKNKLARKIGITTKEINVIS